MEATDGAISFGFSKVVKRKLLNKQFLDDAASDSKEEVDFVRGLVGNKIQGTLKKPKKEELVIPLKFHPGGWDSSNPLQFGGFNEGSEERTSLDDYERVPVADFGLAMLRGMGWKESEGIGLKNKRVVEMREPEVRPRGLGLGAARPQSDKDIHPSSKSNEEVKQLTMKIGAFAVINKGSSKGLYGQIESFDEDNNRVIMKLALGKQMAAVSKFYIDLVDPEEFKKKSKVLNNDKYEEYKSKSEKHQDDGKHDENKPKSEKRQDRDNSKYDENKPKPEKHQDKDNSKYEEYKSKSEKHQDNGKHEERKSNSKKHHRHKRSKTSPDRDRDRKRRSRH